MTSDSRPLDNPAPGGSKNVPVAPKKSLLATARACCDLDRLGKGRMASVRHITESAELLKRRNELRLPPMVSRTTVHNHLVRLARRCGFPSIIFVDPASKNQGFARGQLTGCGTSSPSWRRKFRMRQMAMAVISNVDTFDRRIRRNGFPYSGFTLE